MTARTVSQWQSERLGWNPVLVVDKYANDELDRLGLLGLTKAEFDAEGVKPYVSVRSVGNILLNAGINRLGSLLIGGGGQVYNTANTRIGAGNGSTAVAATDTDLSASAGSANRWFQLASSVTFATQVLTVAATFGTADGNFVWAEWGIDNGSASGNTVTAPLLNRKVAALGTKTSAATWAATMTVTIS